MNRFMDKQGNVLAAGDLVVFVSSGELEFGTIIELRVPYTIPSQIYLYEVYIETNDGFCKEKPEKVLRLTNEHHKEFRT